MLVVSPSSKTFDSFITPPVPVYMQIWLFNVTNPDDIRYHGAKPIIKEVGPFTYMEVRKKFDFVWDHDRGTTIAAKVDKLGPAIQLAVELGFMRFKESLFITRTVGELLFHGYEEPLLNKLTQYLGDPTNSNGRFGFLYPVASKVFGHDKSAKVAKSPSVLQSEHHLPSIRDLILAIIWSQLEEGMDLFEVHTAEELLFGGFPLPEFNFDFSELSPKWLNFTKGWNGTLYDILDTMGVQDLPDWLEDNKLGLMFGRNNTNDGTYTVKTGEKGLSDYLEITEWNGNGSLNFWSDPDCNKIRGTDGSQYSPQVIMSTPHFYMGDKVELAKLEGLHPNKEDHETFLDVEPRTGVTMNAAKKIQINVPLKKYGNLPSFKNVPEVTFPILWINESATVNATMSKDVKKGITLPFVVVNAICGSLIAIGAILLIVGVIRCIRIRMSRKQRKL
ncbi:Lysosome membrane protein 2-like 1 [Homarus americanus]|uniref:Lysosome membrane protein 2-like 1 n=1 Tax=Homarus americanus TaxID=6706 RepID=A0A8J5JRI6_HOMAM|nr:Lysosome membrane protein 2-like 1 [Homarus americanus]